MYRELRALGASFFQQRGAGHTLQPTALVHEAYLRIVRHDKPEWSGKAHFFGVAAKAMRQILSNHAKGKARKKRGGDWHRVTLDRAVALSDSVRDIDLVGLDEALGRLELLDARQARVVELRFFAGLTVDDVAMVLAVSPRTVELDWRMARLWLRRELSTGADS